MSGKSNPIFFAITWTTVCLAFPSVNFAATIFVGESAGAALYEFQSDGSKQTLASPGPIKALASDSSGDVFMSLFGGDIYKRSVSGTESLFAGVSGGGLAIDSNGNLFSAATNIYEITPNGEVSTFVTGNFDDSTVYQAGLAFNSLGDLFSADSTYGNIYKFSAGGTRTVFATGFLPWALAFDAEGDLFASQYNGGLIYRIQADGQRSLFTTIVDPDGVAIGGLAFDSLGNLFVADGSGGKVYEVAPDGGQQVFASGLGNASSVAVQSATPEPATFVLILFSLFATISIRRISAFRRVPISGNAGTKW